MLETTTGSVEARVGESSFGYGEEEALALTTLFINEYLCSRIVGVDDGVKQKLWLLTNNWLEKVAPVSYKPGVAEFLADLGLKRLWEIDVPVEALHDVLLKPIQYRMSNGVDDGELRGFAKRLALVISKLSGVEKRVIHRWLKEVCSLNTDCYLYVAALTLTLSTNI